ncbi:hypothetical protein R6Q59_016070 [Mikania micrantha]
MAWRGSISRAMMSTARTSSVRSTASLPRLRPPPVSAPRFFSRRLGNPRVEWKRWVTSSNFKHRKATRKALNKRHNRGTKGSPKNCSSLKAHERHVPHL